jgi:hypothetical protein
MHLKRQMNKPFSEFKNLVATKKAEVANTYALMKAQYEGLYNTKKDEIMESEQYKMYTKAQKKYISSYSSLRRRYNLIGSSFSALSTKPGCRYIHQPLYWRYRSKQPSYLIRHALHLRLRAW